MKKSCTFHTASRRVGVCIQDPPVARSRVAGPAGATRRTRVHTKEQPRVIDRSARVSITSRLFSERSLLRGEKGRRRGHPAAESGRSAPRTRRACRTSARRSTPSSGRQMRTKTRMPRASRIRTATRRWSTPRPARTGQSNPNSPTGRPTTAARCRLSPRRARLKSCAPKGP